MLGPQVGDLCVVLGMQGAFISRSGRIREVEDRVAWSGLVQVCNPEAEKVSNDISCFILGGP